MARAAPRSAGSYASLAARALSLGWLALVLACSASSGSKSPAAASEAPPSAQPRERAEPTPPRDAPKEPRAAPEAPPADAAGAPLQGNCPAAAEAQLSRAVPAGTAYPQPGLPPTFVTSHGRVVAIGDVHGDLDATRRALVLAAVVDGAGHWVGGNTVAVQIGDVLDRGDDEQAILDWFEVLAKQAQAAGGAFYSLIGNHEQMNAMQSFGYVTDGGWLDFQDTPSTPGDPALADLQPYQFGRAAAFRPGGPYARILSDHNVIVVVDRTVFAHGGLELEHITAGLQALNAEHRLWLRGDGTLSAIWDSNKSPVWNRAYSEDPTPDDCARLEQTLSALCLDRLVVGHTVQPDGITTACDGRVVRIDVGLARHYGGPTQALQILSGDVTILR